MFLVSLPIRFDDVERQFAAPAGESVEASCNFVVQWLDVVISNVDDCDASRACGEPLNAEAALRDGADEGHFADGSLL